MIESYRLSQLPVDRTWESFRFMVAVEGSGESVTDSLEDCLLLMRLGLDYGRDVRIDVRGVSL